MAHETITRRLNPRQTTTDYSRLGVNRGGVETWKELLFWVETSAPPRPLPYTSAISFRSLVRSEDCTGERKGRRETSRWHALCGAQRREQGGDGALLGDSATAYCPQLGTGDSVNAPRNKMHDKAVSCAC